MLAHSPELECLLDISRSSGEVGELDGALVVLQVLSRLDGDERQGMALLMHCLCMVNHAFVGMHGSLSLV